MPVVVCHQHVNPGKSGPWLAVPVQKLAQRKRSRAHPTSRAHALLPLSVAPPRPQAWPLSPSRIRRRLSHAPSVISCFCALQLCPVGKGPWPGPPQGLRAGPGLTAGPSAPLAVGGLAPGESLPRAACMWGPGPRHWAGPLATARGPALPEWPSVQVKDYLPRARVFVC